MIAPEGFKSLADLRDAINPEIRKQVRDALGGEPWKIHEGIDTLLNDRLTPPSYSVLSVVVNEIVAGAIAEPMLNLDLFISSGSSLVSLPSAFLRPSVRLVESGAPEGASPRLDLVKMFRCGELIETLCTDGFYKLSIQRPWSARWVVVNYTTGCIDLAALESACKMSALFDELEDIRTQYYNRTSGLSGVTLDREERYARSHYGSDQRMPSVLKMLSPHNGQPVLLSNAAHDRVLSWLGLEIENDNSLQIDELQPSELILMEFEDNPANKSEIKKRLFPEMSGREFDKHWWAASQVNPNLSAPGRKAGSEHS